MFWQFPLSYRKRNVMKPVFTSLLLALLFLTGWSSCKKTTTTNVTLADGTYKGTFQRQIAGTGQVSNVSIVFQSGNWTGKSETPRYPALCSGTFQLNSPTEITFSEGCTWTADFDWTLILENTFIIQLVGNTYILTKDYWNGTKDIYNLTKI
jgi:hypothetical protein